MTFARLAIAVSLPQLFDYKAENITAADLGRCLTVPFANGTVTQRPRSAAVTFYAV